MDYRTKAINCVKDTALPVQMQWLPKEDKIEGASEKLVLHYGVIEELKKKQ